MGVLIAKGFQAAFIGDEKGVALFQIIATVKILHHKAAICGFAQPFAVKTIGHFGCRRRAINIEMCHDFFFFFCDLLVCIVAQTTTAGTTSRQTQSHTSGHHPHFHVHSSCQISNRITGL